MRLCAHFGGCGGCTLQDLLPDAYRRHKHGIVAQALARSGVAAHIADMASVPPFTRRRASLKLAKNNGRTEIGFHARASHSIVDMEECLVLTPGLTALVQSLRAGLAPLLAEGMTGEFDITETDAGFDLSLSWEPSPAHLAQFAQLAARLGIARISHKAEVLVEHAAPEVAFPDASVKLPPGAFIQPTREGEALLREQVLAALEGAKNIADLFAGCGTFSLPLAHRARVHAVEKDAPMLAALARAARETPGLKPVTTEKRDLFRHPLTPKELIRFDAVLLDPPRAGARAQAEALAASSVRRIVYVSCEAASFARDAHILVRAGFALGPITPIDQFLWSGHIELVAGFLRRG